MPRLLLLVPLAAALAGCGGPAGSGPAPDTRPKAAVPAAIPAPADTAGRKAAAAATHPADTRPARGPRELDALTADLLVTDDGRRVAAAKALRQWGKEAAPAAPTLARVVADSPPGAARQAALEALEAVYPDVAADLGALVGGDDPGRRVAAEKHLAAAVARPDGAALAVSLRPVVVARLAALPAEGRKAGVGFAVAGEEYAALVPVLLRAGPLGDDGFKAIVACAGADHDAGRPLWERAQLTLCEIAVGNPDRRPAALDALNSSLSSRISLVSIRAVGAIGPDARPLVPLLQSLSVDRDENVRRAAAEALKKIAG